MRSGARLGTRGVWAGVENGRQQRGSVVECAWGIFPRWGLFPKKYQKEDVTMMSTKSARVHLVQVEQLDLPVRVYSALMREGYPVLSRETFCEAVGMLYRLYGPRSAGALWTAFREAWEEV